jgi:ribose/xylose/arabinose/galactoside ABC-type transport system permease subunit
VTTTSAPADRRAVLTRTGLAVIGILAFVVFSFALENFLSVDNLINLLNEVALAGIVAVPATFLMMSGQVDLSVGGTAAFVGIALAATVPRLGLVAAVLLAVGSGVLIGLGNGLLVTVGRVDSIPATFASMALLRGLAYLLAGGLAIALTGFRSLGDTRPFSGIALPTWIFGAVGLIAGVLSRSDVGRRSRDTGRLLAAERFDSQRERRWVSALFVVSGLSAALVGLIMASQLGAGVPTAAITAKPISV